MGLKEVWPAAPYIVRRRRRRRILHWHLNPSSFYEMEPQSQSQPHAGCGIANIFGRFFRRRRPSMADRRPSGQVAEPLRAMVMGAPLEDARHLAQRYDRMRQESEVIEVSKRQMKVREAPSNVENNTKLEAAEIKLQELKSNMTVLGLKAVSAMAAAEEQQQNDMKSNLGMVNDRKAQTVMKQFGGSAYGRSDIITDEAEFQQHQKLGNLYISTRSSKHFQRDIVRGVEEHIVHGSKQIEIGTKLSKNSRKYGIESCMRGSTLSKAALCFGSARAQMEKERGNLLKDLGTQVVDPLRAMVMGAPLVDARHLAQCYGRMRQESEAQVIEVSKRKMNVREAPGNVENSTKLEAAEIKLQELKSKMTMLGKKAVSAMAVVEEQQQRLTLHKLISMIESERSYHRRMLQILDQLDAELVSERQRIEASPSPMVDNPVPPPPSYEEANGFYSYQTVDGPTDLIEYFLGEVVHSFEAESSVELNLSVGDYVVVRKVCDDGWAEGECKGRAGWFPFGYVEKRGRVLASKILF